MNNTNNDSISLENQDIICDIEDLLPKLEELQQEYEEDERQKELEDEAWEKRYNKAEAEFNKRSEDMLGMVKPFDIDKHVALLSVGVLFLMCVISPFSFFVNALLAFLIWGFFMFVGMPVTSILDKKAERRKEQIRKELQEIKYREYRILFQQKPSHDYWRKQYNYTEAVNKRLKEQNPQFEFVLSGSYGFSYQIKKMKYVRHKLESGQAPTLDNAVSMMFNYFIEETDRQLAVSKEYFAEKDRMRIQTREYEEEQRRKEEAEYQREREEYARREDQETSWLQEQDRQRQQALDDEIRRDIEHSAYDARRWGKDRQTVRMYDDQLGRSYHERLEEDRKYGYGEDDKMSDVGGDLK
ncbi:hypothetical protein JDS99_29540 [Bacillus cereus group sp. N6]|uniref:hypothetical protein n=1 Tax=Bacillus cereus group sp. N6 TaxID=2794583 RepID=UPI0018F721BF|nr:hypothetical protein [Bacillus cereus group sp. N6]MBJ8113675.1 hypothetical protein [Bacillus cereus group sp. N6]